MNIGKLINIFAIYCICLSSLEAIQKPMDQDHVKITQRLNNELRVAINKRDSVAALAVIQQADENGVQLTFTAMRQVLKGPTLEVLVGDKADDEIDSNSTIILVEKVAPFDLAIYYRMWNVVEAMVRSDRPLDKRKETIFRVIDKEFNPLILAIQSDCLSTITAIIQAGIEILKQSVETECEWEMCFKPIDKTMTIVTPYHISSILSEMLTRALGQALHNVVITKMLVNAMLECCEKYLVVFNLPAEEQGFQVRFEHAFPRFNYIVSCVQTGECTKRLHPEVRDFLTNFLRCTSLEEAKAFVGTRF